MGPGGTETTVINRGGWRTRRSCRSVAGTSGKSFHQALFQKQSEHLTALSPVLLGPCASLLRALLASLGWHLGH